MEIKVDGVAGVQKMLAGMKRGAPKARTLWVNWIGLESQGAMRQQIPKRFSFRGTREGFEKAIVFTQARGTGERKQSATLHVGGPGFGQSRTQNLGVILARHEEANTRTKGGSGLGSLFRVNGNRLIEGGFFLPAKGLRTTTTNPPKQLYPRNIGVAMRADVNGQMFFAKGTKKGSKKSGTGVSFFATDQGVFRRRHTGFGGRTDVDAIWWFRSRVRTPERLMLWKTAQRVFELRATWLGYQAIEEQMFRETL